MNLIIMKKVSANAHFYDVVAPAGVENGNLVVLGTKNSDGTYPGSANTAATDKMLMVTDVALPYEVEKEQNDYVIATGEVIRCLEVSVGDVIDIPQANITATSALAVDKKFVPDAGQLKGECLASAIGTESYIFNIDALYNKNSIAMASLRCEKVQ